MSSTTYTIPEELDGKRLDHAVPEICDISRSQVGKLLKSDRLTYNGEAPKKAGMTVRTGGTVEIFDLPIPKDDVVYPDIAVVSEHTEYLVVEKPAGLLVHPTEANERVTLAGWLLKNYPDVEGVGDNDVRPGIVHRLDREASGLLVVARTQEMFEHLKAQFKERTVYKEYLVLVHGVVEPDDDTIDFDIDRGKDGRMVARPKTDFLKLKNVGKELGGKNALSTFTVEERFVRYSFLKVRIHTGRMHQIRVHLFAYGFPVVGDKLYQNKKHIKKHDIDLGRLFLHAYKLSFRDLSGEEKHFQIGLPDELQNYMDSLV